MRKILLASFFSTIALVCSAATLTVTNTSNSGAGSLRDVIAGANDGDVIEFSSSLLTSGNDTIKLLSVISISKSLTINGLISGTDTLFISGEKSTQIFNINLSANANKNFLFNNVSIVKGSYFNGGAVYFNGGELKILNSNFSDNYSSTDGGAIYFLGTNLIIEDSYFYKDSADDGGVVFTNLACNSLTINNSTFNHNYASQSGGVAYFKADTITVNNCNFNNNYADDYGGAIRNEGDSAHVFINNTKAHNNFAYYSGVFYLRGLNKLVINIDGLIARNNDASAFGGVFQASTYYTGAKTTINISNSELCQNGAIYTPNGGICRVVSTQVDIDVLNCKLDSNSGGDGGVIYAESSSKGTTINLTNSSFDYNKGYTGGVIYTKSTSSVSAASSTVNINNCSMDYNNASYAGVLFAQVSYFGASNNINIANSSLSYDTVYNDGGAIWISTSGTFNMDIANSEFNHNNTINGAGGAIYVQGVRNTYFTATNSNFNYNTSDEQGGAIYITTDYILDAEFNGCTVGNNIAQLDGGGVYLYSTASGDPLTADFNYSTINNNSCVNGNGGGVYAYSQYSSTSTTVKTNKSTIVNNGANFGGGIYAYAYNNFTVLDVKNSTITGNSSNSFSGGGIYARNNVAVSNILLGSSIVGLNGPSNIYNSNTTTILSNGYNIFSDGSITGSAGTDQLGANAGTLNLGVLQNNGGLTNTMMPGAGSIAINMGDPSDLSSAQNGPIQGGRRDVGAADSTCAINYADTVTTCSNYTFNGTTYTTSGIYYDTLDNAGCDTFLILNLTITDIHTATNASICQGDSINFGGIFYKVGGIYKDTLVAANLCDSISELNLTVFSPIATTSSITICNGDSIYFDGTYIKVGGVYRDTLLGSNTCDSIHELTLTVINGVTTTSSLTICNGDSTYFDGAYLKVGGVYRDTLVGANTCDSIHELTLTVINGVTTTSSITICNGDSTYFDGAYLKVGGVYRDTLVGANTCDSIHELTLTVINGVTTTSSLTICNGDSTYFDGAYLKVGGVYRDTLVGSNTCDSIHELTLTVINGVTTTSSLTICNDDSTYFDGAYLKVGGVYRDTLVGANTCDSIHELTLTVINGVTTTSSLTICNGDSTYFDGAYLKVGGVYRDTLVGSNTCDSIHELTLTVINGVTTTSSLTICNGDSTYFDGVYLKVGGVYRDTLVGSNTCDSIHELTLTVINGVTTTSSLTICNGDSTYFDGVYLKVGGVYRDTLPGSNTCDSIHELTLTVTPIITEIIRDTICSTDSVWFSGEFRKIAGSYYDTTTSIVTGCDSITELALETKSCLPPSCSELFFSEYVEGSSNNKVVEIYNPSAFQVDLSNYSIKIYSNGASTAGSTINLSGMLNPKEVYIVSHTSAIDTFKNIANMLSGALTFNGDDAVALFNTSTMIDLIGEIGFDPGSAWTSGGVTTVNKTLVRKPGIGDGVSVNPTSFNTSLEWDVYPIDDSTHLGFHNSLCNSNCSNKYTVINDSICLGATYSFDGNTLNTTGIYKDTIGLVSGCDSIITLNLYVRPIIQSVVNDTICYGGSYAFDGNSLTSTGTYYDTVSTIAGCDSAITLNLYVRPIIQSVVNDTICYGGSYAFDGNSLNATGTYYDTVSTIAGCDSAITLNLYVRPIIQSAVNDTICYGGSYAFDGNSLTSTGTYYDTVSTVAGCDSAITLNLYVRPIIQSVVNDTICYGGSYAFDGNSLTATGTYYDTVSTVAGCDSAITLNLYVRPIIQSVVNDTICYGGSYAFDGNSLAATGTYYDTVSTVAGCDSAITLNLYVRPIIQSVVNDTICYGGSYAFDGNSLAATGTYYDTVSTVAGCDSAITLNLYVRPIIQSVVNDTICYGGSYAFDGNSLTATGTYYDTVSTVAGCDSAITLNLYVRPIIQTSFTDTICGGESYAFGGNIYTSTGSYSDTMSTIGGCDSVSTLNLYVKAAPVVVANSDEDTIIAGGTITYGNTGSTADSYFWDFGDFVYSSLDSVSHTYNTAGTYTVTLKGESINGCIIYDTITVVVLPNTTGVNEIDLNNVVSVYPNPATDIVNVKFDVNKQEKIVIAVLSVSGQIVYQTEQTINDQVLVNINTVNYKRGVYMIRVSLGEKQAIKRVVLTR